MVHPIKCLGDVQEENVDWVTSIQGILAIIDNWEELPDGWSSRKKTILRVRNDAMCYTEVEELLLYKLLKYFWHCMNKEEQWVCNWTVEYDLLYACTQAACVQLSTGWDIRRTSKISWRWNSGAHWSAEHIPLEGDFKFDQVRWLSKHSVFEEATTPSPLVCIEIGAVPMAWAGEEFWQHRECCTG